MSRGELLPGAMAPDFCAPVVGGPYGVDGGELDSRDLRGQVAVLYFYPKDETPGCTAQACGLRDQWERVGAYGAAIFGVSVDPIESHRKFVEKHSLPFALISDIDHRMATDFGVWVEKTLYGRKFMGTERTTFVICPDGKIQSVHRRVKPAEHADILLKDLADLES